MKIHAAVRLRADSGPDLLAPGVYLSKTQPLVFKGSDHEPLDTLVAVLTPDGMDASEVKYGWSTYPTKLANTPSIQSLLALLPRVFGDYPNAKQNEKLSHGSCFVFETSEGWLTFVVPSI